MCGIRAQTRLRSRLCGAGSGRTRGIRRYIPWIRFGRIQKEGVEGAFRRVFKASSRGRKRFDFVRNGLS
ncbi:hypothetical protein CN116_14260 [Sinorhizobium meliloti]|nr:hypothetical protein CN125_09765 [Sinorhizobium meliloti]RVM51634.1 hypothetical protein CN121_03250 [Sinorhizobium meliloti]RVM63101.1 hypothetical protein CN123_25625 [Sinorhizobium meliloti]RVM70001.1 hypothetical protein CN124_07200 [Sinorhizobium meliloti]RVM85315.1 hypothetical protein CN117_10720 [Sinorhizobium meliloti]